MGLNWNEIKSRALLFSKTWADACDENSQAKPFWIDFFEIFGITDKRVATFELHVKKLGGTKSFLDLVWPSFADEALSDEHRAAVDTAYQPSGGKKPCASDAERVAFLFGLYQHITNLHPASSQESTQIQSNRELKQ